MSNYEWSAEEMDGTVSRCVTATFGTNVQTHMGERGLTIVKQDSVKLTGSDQASGRSVTVEISDVDALRLAKLINERFADLAGRPT